MNQNPTLQELSTDYQRVAQAILYLDDHFQDQPSLDEMATAVHLSKFHFQRLFKRWAGVTPNQFLHFLTVNYAKEKLRQSESVFDTALDAGLSSAGRLHDLFVNFEAMTPGQYKEQGQGLNINYGIHPTPFGPCIISLTGRGICALRFVSSEDGHAVIIKELEAEWPRAQFAHRPDLTGPVIERIFCHENSAEPLHLSIKGTNFQVQVWQALLAIPSGAMVTYQDIARKIGSPTAARAVAAAIGRNPVGYIIPCHRVISKTGQAHGYRWGNTRKKALIAYEAAQAAQ